MGLHDYPENSNELEMTSPETPQARSGWPVIALGATSFIPFLGFILGSIAVTWGLLSSRRRAWVGAVVGATGALMNVAALFVLYGAFRRSPEMQKAQAVMVQADLVQLVTALDAWRERTGEYPTTLQELVARQGPLHPINIFDHGRSLFSTTPFQYHPAADHQSFDLYSAGADGVAGNADDIRPMLPDTTGGRTGYRPGG